MLWVRAEPVAEKLLDALRPYLVDAAPATIDLPRVYRVAKALQIEDRSVIEQAIDHLELWLDDATWASSHDDDPWRTASRTLGMLDQLGWSRHAAKEHPARFPAISYRALWSQSVIRIEQHPTGLWVFELRYAPASDGAVIHSPPTARRTQCRASS